MTITKEKAIEKLTSQLQKLRRIISLPLESLDPTIHPTEILQLIRSIETDFGYIFKNNNKYFYQIQNTRYDDILDQMLSYEDIDSNEWIDFSNELEKCLYKIFSIVNSSIKELEDYWDELNFEASIISPNQSNFDTLPIIESICNRFHLVAKQLRTRHNNRETLTITDEYDVQDLFHSLLTIYFDDIRPEEWIPSYAGRASRTDFLLKNEQTIIEIKKTRSGLADKEIGEQLIIDITKYKAHPDCKQLICFVYDQEGLIRNPRGLENDLSKTTDGLVVNVFIRPK
ncbi:MAG TPA: hypothetical protein VK184_25080 [Nostocaceae cyanobacterium]|nr:hypothetical protein [Nostocaceae cyanobacterium]